MAILIGNRDDIVRTTAGFTAGFREGEETWVPDNPAIVKVCLERGHMLKKKEAAAPPIKKEAQDTQPKRVVVPKTQTK